MSTFIPYIGYLASVFLILALIVANDLKFRWFNTAGNVAFITYAIVLHAFPVLLTNGILLAINCYYLFKIYRRQENFELIEFSGEEQLVNKFTSFYKNDIGEYFPGFDESKLKGNLNFVVLRDLVIANMFSATVDADGDAKVLINYTLKKYRDYKVGRFIFDKEKQFLISKGVKRIVYPATIHSKHEQFLKVMGFWKEVVNGEPVYVKRL